MRKWKHDPIDVFEGELALWYVGRTTIDNMLRMTKSKSLPTGFALLKPWPWAFEILSRLSFRDHLEYFVDWLAQAEVQGRELGTGLIDAFELYEYRYIVDSSREPLHLLLYSQLYDLDPEAWTVLVHWLGSRWDIVAKKARDLDRRKSAEGKLEPPELSFI